MKPHPLNRRTFVQAAATAAAGLALKPAFAVSRELAGLTLKQASELLRSKETSAVELTRACLARIEKYNPALSAYVGRESQAEVTGVDHDSLLRFRRQPGRIAHDYAYVVSGAERMVQHVGAERSRCAEDDHSHLPTLMVVCFWPLSIAPCTKLSSRISTSSVIDRTGQLDDDASPQRRDAKRAVVVANLDHSFADVLVGVLRAKRYAFNGEHDVTAHD
jgi:hypothetical protein